MCFLDRALDPMITSVVRSARSAGENPSFLTNHFNTNFNIDKQIKVINPKKYYKLDNENSLTSTVNYNIFLNVFYNIKSILHHPYRQCPPIRPFIAKKISKEDAFDWSSS